MAQQTIRKGRTHAWYPERTHIQMIASPLQRTEHPYCFHEILAREGKWCAIPVHVEDALDPREDSQPEWENPERTRILHVP